MVVLDRLRGKKLFFASSPKEKKKREKTNVRGTGSVHRLKKKRFRQHPC
jgi:hypothetical protein